MNSPQNQGCGHESTDIGIIGGGPAGIAMGFLLRRQGIASFTILEKNPSFGGTWYENSYPGAACDVPSHLYSFSFFINRLWSSSHASQPEILQYLQDCAAAAALEKNTLFGFAVTAAVWDSDVGRWTVTGSNGQTISFRHIVSAIGTLNHPNMPSNIDPEAFDGDVFHTARWPKDFSLAGKTVAVVGTGASAAQIVPAIAGKASEVLVFQREPNWVLPNQIVDFEIKRLRLFTRVTGAARLYRWWLYWKGEARIRGLVRSGGTRGARRQARALEIMRQEVRDLELRNLLTPRHEIGCKRVLFAPHWFDAMQRDNVKLVPEAVDHLRGSLVVTESGDEFLVDTVVLSTGFTANAYLRGIDVVADGVRLQDFWDGQGGPEAYLGICVPGFPNLFLLYGPNTNLISSIFFAIECQARYVIRLLRSSQLLNNSPVEVRAESHKRFQDEIGERLSRTVWTSSCNNYFTSQTGKVVTQWPGSSLSYWLRTRRVRRRDFV